jgi:hypothetical protein
MLIDELRENVRSFYWNRVWQNDKADEYDDIREKAMAISKEGIDYLIRNTLSPIVKECLIGYGFKVTYDGEEYTISWRINNE